MVPVKVRVSFAGELLDALAGVLALFWARIRWVEVAGRSLEETASTFSDFWD